LSWAKLGQVKAGGRLLAQAGGATVLDLKAAKMRGAFTRRFGGMI
jgi:hypothetical protein